MVAAIRMEDLARSFRATVAPLDLEVAEDEMLGCLGPEGAGKSMTFRCLLGNARGRACGRPGTGG
ncbi:MAG TPA: ATP-binding cassette domain-containing protein [Streptosporangiaceae bacterium]|nr:ATP-binding cassette domain-containing protein [Streptosporangiaceae bacterium]